MRRKKIRYEDRIWPWDKTHRCAGSLAQRVSIRCDPETQKWILYHLNHDWNEGGTFLCYAADIAFCPFCGVPMEKKGDANE